MNQAATQIPAGYRENAKGALVPIATIRESDLMMDGFVTDTAAKWKRLQGQIREFKVQLLGDIQAMLDLIAEKYSVKRGGEKGNVQVFSFNGKYKLLVAVAESITFGPELQAARKLITDCLHTWTAGSAPELKAVVDAAFSVDSKGGVSVGKILALRRYNIDNEEWREAMRAIGDAIMVVGSKQYVRLYERNAVGTYIPLPLDIAAL